MTATTTSATAAALGELTDRDGYAFVTQERALIGNGVAARFEPSADPLTRFTEAARWCESELAPSTIAFASFTFAAPSPGSSVAIPQRLIDTAAGDGRSGAAALLARDSAKVRYAGSSIPETRWMEAVAMASAEIRAGDYDKVVLARDLHTWSTTPFEPSDLALRLAQRFPSCMTFVHEGLVGATPELLLRRHGAKVTSVVLAGTALPDEASGAALLASSKDRVEHEIARESVRAVLAPLCAELKIDPEPELLRLDNVQHLATRFRGRLSAPAHVLELVGALHPTAAVGGTPTSVAQRRIAELEGMDRGRYAGPVGIVEHGGDGVFGIALRCAELSGDRARLFSGCGIVGDSLPEAELEETRLKLLAMQSVLG